MAQDFITQFHGIEGASVGERQKNLNKLLKNISFTPEEKYLVLDNLTPKTYLENLFYVDVLIHFKDASRLLEIFRDGNGAFVSKILKQPWFFHEAFENLGAEELVYNLLPDLSFSLKIKLLRRVSELYSEEKIDKIFDNVMNRYGLFIATSFITACSSVKIADILKSNNIKLTTHQLKILYNKHPNLITIYIEEQKQYGNKNILSNKVLTYLAQKNPIYFWELIEKYKINNDIKLGRRTTKKLIPAKKEGIVANPKKYIKYLRHETLVRKLNKQGDFKNLYYNLFPKNIEVLESNTALCNILLKYYPRRDQYNLFKQTFHAVIKEDLKNYSSCVQDSILAVIPDSKERETWAQLKYKESSDEEYLKFYEVNNAVMLIKERVNTTSSIKSRSKLLALLVKSCAVVNDLKVLEEVLHYFSVRHRNDNKTTRADFLQALEANFNVKKLNDSHWRYIHEILTVQSLNKEYGMHNSKLRIRHIEYLFNSNGSEEDKNYFILEYIKEQLINFGLHLDVFDELKNVGIQKTILLQSIEHIDTLITTQNLEYNKSFLKSQLFAHLFTFNMKHPENKIDIQENTKLVADLKRFLKDSYLSYLFNLSFAKSLCKLNRNDFENELLSHYWNDKNLLQFSMDKALQWYLKHDPEVIVSNFDKILESFPPFNYRILYTIKLYSHLSLDIKTKNHFLHHLHHGANHRKHQFVQPLSLLNSPEEYIKNMEDLNLIPTTPKLVLEDGETRISYGIQRAWLKNFKNTCNPLKYLPFLLDKFCQGDYLQISLAPLYFAFHKLPENKLLAYLDSISSNKNVSVKKHALFLAICVFNQEIVTQISNSFQETKNDSLKKYLSLSSLRYFTKKPNQENFEKVILYMKFLKEHDVESLKILISVEIPTIYKAPYVLNLWNILENLKMKKNAMGFGSLMSSLLEKIDERCIQNLPQPFCHALINTYLTKTGNEEISSIYQFVIQFLMYHKNHTENFAYVFNIVSNYKDQFWQTERRVVYNFFYAFYTLACDADTDLNFVINFSTKWENIFTANDTFEEYILLNLLRIKKQTEDDFESYSKQIVQFAELINTTYGEFAFSKFIPVLSKFCEFGKGKDRIELLINILKHKITKVTCNLVIELISLKGDLFYKDRIRPVYREIDLILKNVLDPNVQMYYNLIFRSN